MNVRFREAKKLSSNKSVATFATEILSAPLFVVVICKSSLTPSPSVSTYLKP